MIAKHFNISCSPNSERVVALAYLAAPERVLPIAKRLEGSSSGAVQRLALEISRLEPEQARSLAAATARLPLKIINWKSSEK